MKKFLAGIAAAAIITVPMTSFALESMSKGALKKATGQAGVSIGLDNIVLYKSGTPVTTYWDNDGTTILHKGDTETSTAGTVTAAGVQITNTADTLITIGAVLDGTKYGAHTGSVISQFSLGAMAGKIGIAQTADELGQLDPTNGTTLDSTGDAVATNNFVLGISPLTIDVGTCQALTAGFSYNTGTSGLSGVTNVVGVVIGLPTVEINKYYNEDVKSIKVITADAGQSINGNDTGTSSELISIQKSGNSTLAVLGGRLEIAPH